MRTTCRVYSLLPLLCGVQVIRLGHKCLYPLALTDRMFPLPQVSPGRSWGSEAAVRWSPCLSLTRHGVVCLLHVCCMRGLNQQTLPERLGSLLQLLGCSQHIEMRVRCSAIHSGGRGLAREAGPPGEPRESGLGAMITAKITRLVKQKSSPADGQQAPRAQPGHKALSCWESQPRVWSSGGLGPRTQHGQ